jgi:hypothetical protein
MTDRNIQPVRESDRALFRAHAAARLRGDAAEALRLARQIGEARRMAHLLYVLYLFTATVYDEYGDTPDPWDLAELTKRLHERHFRPGGEFRAIRAEAMIRGVCGESPLMTEVPAADQPAYMWAVIAELTDPEATDAAIAERLDRAEAIGAELVGSGWDRLFDGTPASRRAPEQRTEAESGASGPQEASPEPPDPGPMPTAETTGAAPKTAPSGTAEAATAASPGDTTPQEETTA